MGAGQGPLTLVREGGGFLGGQVVGASCLILVGAPAMYLWSK